MTSLELLGEELARANRVSEKYRSVLASIEGRESMTSAQEAFDAELEKLAQEVEPYLAAYRDWLEAASLHRSLNRTDLHFQSTPEELAFQKLFTELGERAKTAQVERDRLRGEHGPDVDRLRLLLKLRGAVVTTGRSV